MLLLLLLFIIIFLIIINKDNKENLESSNIPVLLDSSKIPKVIYQTYFDKSLIPQKVYDNIKKYAPDYQHVIFDDNECIQFLSKHFEEKVVDKFKSLNLGAHKADLFRYCILYKFGGIYLDIKTELIKPLNEIFDKPHCIYTSLSIYEYNMTQGVIACPPNLEFFKKLIDLILQRGDSFEYFEICRDMYIEIQKHVEIKPGFLKGKEIDFYLFTEKISRNKNDCYDGLDRHGICDNIYDNDEKIFKFRYSDYPWK